MRYPVGHPLEPLFERAAESLTTALSPASLEAYRTALRSFCVTWARSTARSAAWNNCDAIRIFSAG